MVGPGGAEGSSVPWATAAKESENKTHTAKNRKNGIAMISFGFDESASLQVQPLTFDYPRSNHITLTGADQRMARQGRAIRGTRIERV